MRRKIEITGKVPPNFSDHDQSYLLDEMGTRKAALHRGPFSTEFGLWTNGKIYSIELSNPDLKINFMEDQSIRKGTGMRFDKAKNVWTSSPRSSARRK